MGVTARSSEQQQLLSNMARGHEDGENSPYYEGQKAYERDRYHPTKNPDGVIELGLAGNQLGLDLVEEWSKNNPGASTFTPGGISGSRDILLFDDYHGLPDFRNAVAKFMERVRGVTFDPHRIVMSSGETGGHETVAFCLAEPGEAFLIPTPYHPGFDRDLTWRTGVQLVPVLCESSNDFKITRAALEAGYEKAQKANIRLKGVLISNPLGTFLDGETLRSLVSFINEKAIHLVCDETFFAKAFMGKNFISIAEIIEDENIKCDRDLIHIVYNLSKDMGCPGYGVGIIYSYNDDVVNRARRMSRFGKVSSQTQYLFASMLSDYKFVERFLAEGAKRLAARYTAFTRGLAQVGIGCSKSNAGLFLWMDLHHLLKEQTYEAEMKLWQVIINEDKLNVSPGSSFHCTNPGWFRVCIANMDDQTMEVALSRIKTFVLKNKPALMPVNT